MVKNGSILDFAQDIQFASDTFKRIEASKLGRKLALHWEKATAKLSAALKAHDYETLLALEKIAVQHDSAVFNTALAQSSEQGHERIIERWRIGCDPQKAREDFLKSHAPENISKARVMDTAMERLISMQRNRLINYAKGNATAAERVYLAMRNNCLKAIYDEHMRHIAHALGHGKGKSLSR